MKGKEAVNARSSQICSIITIYMMLKPLYLTKSGSLQLGDVFLMLSAIWLVSKNGWKITFAKAERRWVLVFMNICFYQCIVNILWYAISMFQSGTADTKYVVSCLYYIFNLMTVIVVSMIHKSAGTRSIIRSVANGAFYSSIVMGVGLILNLGKQLRNTSFFNNPNQLGFHAVILLTILFMYWNQFSTAKKVLTTSFCFWAVIASLSKAAFFSMVCVSLAIIVKNDSGLTKKKMIRNVFLLLLFSLSIYLLLYSDISNVYSNKTLSSFRQRILNMMNENDSELGSGRGYNRILEMGNNYLWGMGEGAYNRFKSLTGLEIHSTYVSIFVSYGVIGAIGYLYLFGKAVIWKGRAVKHLLGLSGILLYGLTHNGIRNTIMWILFIMIVIEKSTDSQQARLEEAYVQVKG